MQPTPLRPLTRCVRCGLSLPIGDAAWVHEEGCHPLNGKCFCNPNPFCDGCDPLSPVEDPLAAAQGCLVGSLAGALVFAVIGAVIGVLL